MRNFFVTGGSGFLGSNLVLSLLKGGNKVSVFDNLSRGNARRLSKISKEINFFNGDVKNYDDLLSKSSGHDFFIHMAAINGTEFFYSKPQEVLDVSIRGILNAIEVCKKNNIKNFIFASSSEVYQNPYLFPTPENVELKIPDIFNPRYSYGGGKLISELICSYYYKDFFEKLIIFRPHNVYGPDMGWEHVIPQLILSIKKTKKLNKTFIEIKGDGNQTRSFIFINDFIEALNKVIFKGEHRNIYHIGNNDEISILELTKMILKSMNTDLEIRTSQQPKGETDRRCPDDSKIKKLGYKKEYELRDGLKSVIKWYLENDQK